MTTLARPRGARGPIAIAFACLLAASAVGLHAGPSGAGLGEGIAALGQLRARIGAGAAARSLLDRALPAEAAADPATAHAYRTARIVFGLRLPRVALALVVGASLSVAGVAFQALLRNPLADPFILGVSGGAAVGAAAALLFWQALAAQVGGAAAVPLAAFAGALAATGLVYGLARERGGLRGERLLLTGVVVNAFLSAVILLANHLAPPGRRLVIVTWLTGNLGAVPVGANELAAIGGASVVGLVAFRALARDLDLLALGDEAAESLGVPVARVRAALFAAGSLVTAAAVAFAGLIGFVGLIVPHACRLVLGPAHRRLVPVAFLAGGALLALADAAARTVLAPEEVPVGILTALAGGPVFLWLLRGAGRPGSRGAGGGAGGGATAELGP